jgi:hypothetical protein
VCVCVCVYTFCFFMLFYNLFLVRPEPEEEVVEKEESEPVKYESVDLVNLKVFLPLISFLTELDIRSNRVE